MVLSHSKRRKKYISPAFQVLLRCLDVSWALSSIKSHLMHISANNVALVVGCFAMNPTPVVGFRYSPDEVDVIQSIAQEAAELFPVGKLYKNMDELRQELN
jgi:hypothetical protein